jgi:hypothetical protein
MKLFDVSKINLLLLGFVVALVIGGGSANAGWVIGTPTNLGPTVNSSSHDAHPSISADGLSLYFASTRPGGYGREDLWVTTRATTDDQWGPPRNLGSTVNSPDNEGEPCISADGLSLFFHSTRPGGYGQYDIWVTTRPTISDPWSSPVNLGPTVNSSAPDWDPSISADGLTLYFSSTRSGGYGDVDVWLTTRASKGAPWDEPVNLGPVVNTPYEDAGPSISADGLVLLFHSDRPGGYGDYDIWVITRPTKDALWGTPVNLGPAVNTAYSESEPSISADGLELYFCDFRNPRPGGVGSRDLWQVSITFVIDFNGDGRVDFKDFSILAQYWLQDESLVDIAPFPGDGMVDYKDLAVFVEDWLTGVKKASNPDPVDGALGVDIDADLSWTAGASATSHDVYFGTSSPGTFRGNQTATTFDPGMMAGSTTYYWRIDSVNGSGKTTGTVWSFTTVVLEATNPSPSNGSSITNLDADLSWTAGAGATSHDVYFGTSSPPPFVCNQTAMTFDPGTMAYYTTYYWRIDEVNKWGTATGEIWSFTTFSPPPPP